VQCDNRLHHHEPVSFAEEFSDEAIERRNPQYEIAMDSIFQHKVGQHSELLQMFEIFGFRSVGSALLLEKTETNLSVIRDFASLFSQMQHVKTTS